MRDRILSAWMILAILATTAFLFAIFFFTIKFIPNEVRTLFGPPADSLDHSMKYLYSINLYIQKDQLMTENLISSANIDFQIQPGETAEEIANRLQREKIIPDARVFINYLIYTGIDRKILTGLYQLPPKISPVEIARRIHNENPDFVKFSILTGWRAEEIADLIPTSGLEFSESDFLQSVHASADAIMGNDAKEIQSAEGFLFPGDYLIERKISPTKFVQTLTDKFFQELPEGFDQDIKEKGLTLYQAVVLASIIQREIINKEEAPIIASVFLNRLKAEIPLQSDPTVQYALGYYEEQETWWKNPLNEKDLQILSPYNTYLYKGLPPGPICNPGKEALRAVSQPDETGYYYFRLACDGSGRHVFSGTYAEHLAADCE